MIRNYFVTALRNLRKNKIHSFINVAGLSVGMAVALLIALWIWDEVSFDHDNPNHARIGQIFQNTITNGDISTWMTMPMPISEEIRQHYSSDFKYVVMASWNETHVLSNGTKQFAKNGTFFEPKAPELLHLNMETGSWKNNNDPYSILLSSSFAKAIFGNDDPMGRILKLDGNTPLKVGGVYNDLPYNSSFSDISYILPWELKMITNPWMRQMDQPWDNNSFLLYVQLSDNVDFATASKKIRDIKMKFVASENKKYKPSLFVHPMDKWHLYGDFKNGINTGGRIQFVWMFGIIGMFVLLLACINFMNLSTARSEKRAKEVGIRKAIGSLRRQLIYQFYFESIFISFLAFLLCLGIVQMVLPFFNDIADKKMTLLWKSPLFWILGIGFSLFTGLIAGSYPALYLSSFRPVKVLKGTFKAGRLAAIPRQALVILQFSVSVMLVIGTIVVFKQIQFAKDRPVGVNAGGLISLQMFNKDIHSHIDAIRTELKNDGAITEMAESYSPITGVWQTNGGFEWQGKDPNLAVDFPNSYVSYDYGKTVGWQFTQGRDFARDYATDSAAFIMNESAVKFIGFKNPIGETIKWDGRPMKVIGVIKDVITESPYANVRPQLYFQSSDFGNFALFRLNTARSTQEDLSKIESVLRKYSPQQPFNYQFADEDYGRKFGNEVRIGKLATFFAALAIFISCLGLFGMASFMAEQRTKEIGVRKVLGASVLNLWQLLSKDFVMLVIISLLISSPLAYFFMSRWLQSYEYRAELSWWVFAAAGSGALLITIITVSFQSIRAALMNPVKSLRTE